jgi:hypothetical protein
MTGAHLLAALVLTVGATVHQPPVATSVSPPGLNSLDIDVPPECRGADIYIATTADHPTTLWGQSPTGSIAPDQVKTQPKDPLIYHFHDGALQRVKVLTVSEDTVQAALACWNSPTITRNPTRTSAPPSPQHRQPALQAAQK